MRRRGILLLIVSALAGAATGLTGCASLGSLTPDTIHRDATRAYVVVAEAINAEEAFGLSLSAYAHAEGRKLTAWKALTIEREIYARSGPHPLTALDTLADSLKPQGQ